MGILHDASVYVLCCPTFSHMDYDGISISLMSQLADLGSCCYLFGFLGFRVVFSMECVRGWLVCRLFLRYCLTAATAKISLSPGYRRAPP